MKKSVQQVQGPTAVLQRDDIDTDALFPAQFLKVTTRTGMAKYLFADWIQAGHAEADFVKQGRPIRVLVAPRNFGCGSSREHAVWALADYGIEAILALSYGDIFRNNCVKNDVVAATVTPEVHAQLLAALSAAGPEPVLALDVDGRSVSLPDGSTLPFELAPGHAEQLMSDVDDIGRTLRYDAQLRAHEERVAREAPWLVART